MMLKNEYNHYIQNIKPFPNLRNLCLKNYCLLFIFIFSSEKMTEVLTSVNS